MLPTLMSTATEKSVGADDATHETRSSTIRFTIPMKSVLAYGFAIFSSAFLLFQVQPLIAKIILPWFGGGAEVWIVCLMFFQLALLLGYSYAHLLTESFRPRAQRWIHATVIAASFLVLPILPRASWKPIGPETPAVHVLLLLGVTVGLPYFVLSSTSPLLQAWYARTRAGSAPYRFYALSNAGSMLALLSYPVLIEPKFSSSHQAMGWSVAYAGVALCCGAMGFLGSESVAGANTEVAPSPEWKTQLLWIALAACASALLLAITNQISQNVASVPFLWIVPLSLYLLSFILCFDARGWYSRGLFLRLLGVMLGGMAYALAPSFESLPIKILILLFCAGLFVCCMFCHGELARLKPDPAHVTRFYLMCAAGGAIGAVFVALLAPRIFSGYYELHVSLGACAILVLAVHYRDPQSEFRETRWQPAWLILIGLVVAIIFSLVTTAREQAAEARLAVRNFYGVLRVIDGTAPDSVVVKGDSALSPDNDARYRRLMNGTIDHGLQFLSPSRQRWPTTYYGPDSGIGVALRAARERGSLHVGLIGLGVGTIATYGQSGDRYTIYEINPLDVRIANQEFTFLRDSQAAIDVVMGDGRLSLEREPPQRFDVLAVDAFSGDSIPVHLLTRQAFELYFRHLNSNGVLAVHISNKYLDLKPVVAAAAACFGKEAVMVSNSDDHPKGIYAASWILMGNQEGFLGKAQTENAGNILPPGNNRDLWTDDYSSLLKILK
jgi:thiosulfate reductase cytochrome b subunit